MGKDKYKSLGKNSLYVFIGNIGGKAIALLMLPFYTRWLSVADYGTIDMITGYSVPLCDIITCCICQAIFIFPKQGDSEDKKKYFSSGLFFSAIAIILTTGILKAAVDFTVPSSNLLNRYFNIIAIVALCSFIQNYSQNFIRSIDKMKVYSLIGIIYTSSTAIFSFLLMPQWGVMGYVTAIAAASITATLYSVIGARLYSYFSISHIKFSFYKEMLAYSAPLILNIIISFIISFINRPIMEQFQGLEAVGTFAVANKFPSVISTLIPIFCMAWQISVMEEFGKKEYEKFYNNIFRTLSFILIGGSILLIPFSKILIAMFASDKYAEAWVYIPILTIATYFSFTGFYVGTNFSATKQSKYFLYSAIVTAATSIPYNFLLIPQYGIWGCTFSILLAQITFAVSRYYYSRKFVIIRQKGKYLLMLATFAVTTAVTIYWNNDLLSYSVCILAIGFLLAQNKDICLSLLNNIYKYLKKKK